MRKFKVQYSQVFEYDVDAADLDGAARSVQAQVQPDLVNGFIKVIQVVEIGAGSIATATCKDCASKPLNGSRILRNWPRKVAEKKKTR